MSKTIKIGSHTVGDGHPTFVIAEIGINHGGDVKVASQLVKAAVAAGADAVKFQTYVTEKRVKPGSPIFDVLKKCELSHADQLRLKQEAEKLGALFFSTPFDEESVEFLVGAGVKLFKIASFDIVNGKLLRAVAASRLPVIVSRGMADGAEIDTAVDILKKAGSPFALLHCISAYPTPTEQANLRVIRTMTARYDCPIGYSDHTLDLQVPVLAVAAGACIIEKHFTLDKTVPGPDHSLSADPVDLKQMIGRIREVETILGRDALTTYDAEKDTRQYRRQSE